MYMTYDLGSSPHVYVCQLVLMESVHNYNSSRMMIVGVLKDITNVISM